jgi:hypothetical protein
MIKKQVVGVLIGIVLFMGCSKPKVDVLPGKEGANFILLADPKDAKISIFKKDITKEPGKQILDVEFVLQGKSIEMNLLSNPLFMKLELGSEYTYKVEKSGFVTQEGEVILKLGENLEKNIILYTEEELKSKKEENWSEYIGEMNWESASKKCNEVAGRRLPSIRELKLAYEAGITKSWQKDGNNYWSSTPYDAESYSIFYVSIGDTSDGNRYDTYNVRCRR